MVATVQVFAVKLFAIDFVPFAVLFFAFAVEFVPFEIEFNIICKFGLLYLHLKFITVTLSEVNQPFITKDHFHHGEYHLRHYRVAKAGYMPKYT